MGTRLTSMMHDAELDGFCAGQENERAKIIARIEVMRKEVFEWDMSTLNELKSWITTRPKGEYEV